MRSTLTFVSAMSALLRRFGSSGAGGSGRGALSEALAFSTLGKKQESFQTCLLVNEVAEQRGVTACLFHLLTTFRVFTRVKIWD